eukprot:13061188-Alexandrium_andersonii.AAC.1
MHILVSRVLRLRAALAVMPGLMHKIGSIYVAYHDRGTPGCVHEDNFQVARSGVVVDAGPRLRVQGETTCAGPVGLLLAVAARHAITIDGDFVAYVSGFAPRALLYDPINAIVPFLRTVATQVQLQLASEARATIAGEAMDAQLTMKAVNSLTGSARAMHRAVM